VRLRAAGSGGWDQPSSPRRGHRTGPPSPLVPNGGSVWVRENQEALFALPPAAVGPPGHARVTKGGDDMGCPEGANRRKSGCPYLDPGDCSNQPVTTD
jgi:hypothetical protein